MINRKWTQCSFVSSLYSVRDSFLYTTFEYLLWLQFCVFMWFLVPQLVSLCIYTCFLCFFFGSFISVCLFCFTLLCLFLILSFYYFFKISVYILVRQKNMFGIGCEGKWGGDLGEVGGGETIIKFILWRKSIFNLKIKKKVLHLKENAIAICQQLGSLFSFQWSSKMQQRTGSFWVNCEIQGTKRVRSWGDKSLSTELQEHLQSHL